MTTFGRLICEDSACEVALRQRINVVGRSANCNVKL